MTEYMYTIYIVLGRTRFEIQTLFRRFEVRCSWSILRLRRFKVRFQGSVNISEPRQLAEFKQKVQKGFDQKVAQK